MRRRRLNIEAFLGGLKLHDESAYVRQWCHIQFLEVERVSSELLNAAFDAIESWSWRVQIDFEPNIAHASMSVFTLISRAIVDSESGAEACFRRAVVHCRSPNWNVVPGAFLLCEQHPEFKQISLPILRSVALFNHSEPDDKPISIRGLAYKSLYILDADAADDPILRPARIECAQGLLHWAKAGSSSRSDEWAEIANALIWC